MTDDEIKAARARCDAKLADDTGSYNVVAREFDYYALDDLIKALDEIEQLQALVQVWQTAAECMYPSSGHYHKSAEECSWAECELIEAARELEKHKEKNE